MTRTTKNLEIVLNTPQKSLKISKKNSRNPKLSNPKKSFDHPRHLKSGVPPPPGL